MGGEGKLKVILLETLEACNIPAGIYEVRAQTDEPLSGQPEADHAVQIKGGKGPETAQYTWWLFYNPKDPNKRLFWPANHQVGWLVTGEGKGESMTDGTMTGFKSAVTPKVERTSESILFQGMSPKQCVEALIRMEEQDNMEVGVHVEFDKMHLVEGLIAFQSALEQRYGRYFAESTPGMFGMKVPPTLLGVEVAPGVTKEVIWGGFGIPGVEGQLQSGIAMRNEMPVFSINGKVKQKHKAEVDELVKLTNELGRAQSIYKGRALELMFPDPDEVENPMEYAPKFMELGEVNPPVFNEDVQATIDNYIYEDIEATTLTRLNKLPIKKGILLVGQPGVGKTLLAHTLAQKCIDNKWTFAYIRDVKDISKAVSLVQRNGWGPAFIFAEDVDRVVGMDRTDAVNQILNTIDGIDGKLSDIEVLFTSNDISVIHKTMLRPGRLDVVINIEPPDAFTAIQLIKREAGSSLDEDEDLYAVGELLKGTMPAVVVQVVQRAKRAAQRRIRLAAPKWEQPQYLMNPAIKAEDLVIAARSMTKHIELLKPLPTDERTPLEKAADTLAKAIQESATPPLDLESAAQWPHQRPSQTDIDYERSPYRRTPQGDGKIPASEE